MSKARKSRRRKTTTGGQQHEENTPVLQPGKRYKAAVYSVLLAVLVLGGGSLWQIQTCEAAFLDLASKGILKGVRNMSNLGQSHLARGQAYTYPGPFPTSGPHAPAWTEPGIYTSFQPDVMLVHALEHGNIVIHYDKLKEEDVATLSSWADLYTRRWSGIVVTKRPGLGDQVVLTAWTKILRQKTFDASAAAMFIDAFRGRGPENPVR